MIRLVTDSTADFTNEEIREMGLGVVPLMVSFGDDIYKDGVDLPLERFYSMLTEAKALPTTTQPNPSAFLGLFAAAKRSGDTVICVVISGLLSGTLQSARIAKEEADYDKIHIIDSGSATLAENLLIRRAYERIAQGFSAEQIVADLEQAKKKLCLFAVIDDLKYLRMGGRLSTVAAVGGSLLGIKPVVGITSKTNGLELLCKARGIKSAFESMLNMIDKEGGLNREWPLLAGCTGDISCVGPIIEQVVKPLDPAVTKINPIGTVVGTHAGPGASGIAFFCK